MIPRRGPGRSRVPRTGRGVRLDAGGHRLQRAGRDGVQARVRPVALELGDEAIVDVADVHARRTSDARRAAGVHADRPVPATTVKVRRADDIDATSWSSCSRSPTPGAAAGRARLLDGAVAPRRPGRQRVRRWRPPTWTGSCAGCCTSCRGVPDGLSLDLMRRDRDADNGLNEFMIAAADRGVRRARRHVACRSTSRSSATRIERGERIGAGPVLRLWRRTADVRVAVVADRVAVPVQREVPARTGSRGSCPSRPPVTCPASRWRRSRPRRSSSGPSGSSGCSPGG